MVQNYKKKRLSVLKDELKEYSNFIFTDYRGMNVQQLSSLRNMLREKNVSFHVVKNLLVKRAFKDLGLDGFDGFLVNPTALACFNIDPTEVSKIFSATAKETTLRIKGGYVGGRLLSAEDIEMISKLPSREALIAQVVGLLNAPVAGLVMALGGIIIKFVRTLKEIERLKM